MQPNAPSRPVAVSPESLTRKHESSAPHLRNVLIIASSVIFMLLLSLASARFLIHDFSKQRPMQSMQPLGLLTAPGLKPLERFPKPNLQIDDDHDERMALVRNQNQKLGSYGWVDRSNGIVRIPITRAMDLILQRGLPTRTNDISQTGESPLQLIQERPEQR